MAQPFSEPISPVTRGIADNYLKLEKQGFCQEAKNFVFDSSDRFVPHGGSFLTNRQGNILPRVVETGKHIEHFINFFDKYLLGVIDNKLYVYLEDDDKWVQTPIQGSMTETLFSEGRGLHQAKVYNEVVLTSGGLDSPLKIYEDLNNNRVEVIYLGVKKPNYPSVTYYIPLSEVAPSRKKRSTPVIVIEDGAVAADSEKRGKSIGTVLFNFVFLRKYKSGAYIREERSAPTVFEYDLKDKDHRLVFEVDAPWNDTDLKHGEIFLEVYQTRTNETAFYLVENRTSGEATKSFTHVAGDVTKFEVTLTKAELKPIKVTLLSLFQEYGLAQTKDEVVAILNIIKGESRFSFSDSKVSFYEVFDYESAASRVDVAPLLDAYGGDILTFSYDTIYSNLFDGPYERIEEGGRRGVVNFSRLYSLEEIKNNLEIIDPDFKSFSFASVVPTDDPPPFYYLYYPKTKDNKEDERLTTKTKFSNQQMFQLLLTEITSFYYEKHAGFLSKTSFYNENKRRYQGQKIWELFIREPIYRPSTRSDAFSVFSYDVADYNLSLSDLKRRIYLRGKAIKDSEGNPFPVDTSQQRLYTDGGVPGNGFPPRAKYCVSVGTYLYLADIKYHEKAGDGGAAQGERAERLVYSKYDQIYAFPRPNLLDIDGGITGLFKFRDNPIVTSRDKSYRVQGRQLKVLFEYDNNIGLIAARSPVETSRGTIYASSDGIYVTTGLEVLKISSHIQERYNLITNKDKIFSFYDRKRERLYFFYGGLGDPPVYDRALILDLTKTEPKSSIGGVFTEYVERSGLFRKEVSLFSGAFVEYKEQIYRGNFDGTVSLFSANTTIREVLDSDNSVIDVFNDPTEKWTSKIPVFFEFISGGLFGGSINTQKNTTRINFTLKEISNGSVQTLLVSNNSVKEFNMAPHVITGRPGFYDDRIEVGNLSRLGDSLVVSRQRAVGQSVRVSSFFQIGIRLGLTKEHDISFTLSLASKAVGVLDFQVQTGGGGFSTYSNRRYPFVDYVFRIKRSDFGPELNNENYFLVNLNAQTYSPKTGKGQIFLYPVFERFLTPPAVLVINGEGTLSRYESPNFELYDMSISGEMMAPSGKSE